MTPERLYRFVVRTLQQTRRRMNSVHWRRALEVLPPRLRVQAGLMAGRIQGESLRLEVAAPGQLEAAIAANGPALLAAAQRVQRILERKRAIAPLIATSADLVALALRSGPRAAAKRGGRRDPKAAAPKKPRARTPAAAGRTPRPRTGSGTRRGAARRR